MSEKEKDIVQAIIEGLPKMTDFEKGYILGVVESKGSANEKEGPDGIHRTGGQYDSENVFPG